MNKIYWSKVQNPEEWTELKSYFFPFAEKISKIPGGWKILDWYMTVRLWLDK